MAAGLLPSMTPVTSAVSMGLLRILGRPPISDLVAALTHVEGLRWHRYGDYPRSSFGAVLAQEDPEAEAPTAWAWFNPPPQPGVQIFHQEYGCADFIVAIEPRTGTGDDRPPAPLEFWYRWFVHSLSAPTSVHALLADELGLQTPGDPPVRVAVFMSAPEALTQLVEVETFRRVPGRQASREFLGGATADSPGQDARATAKAWIMQMCDRDLPLDGYEQSLLTLG